MHRIWPNAQKLKINRCNHRSSEVLRATAAFCPAPNPSYRKNAKNKIEQIPLVWGAGKEKGEREREKTWVFPARIDFELNSVVRGTSAADTPMSIQDFDVLISIRDFDVLMQNKVLIWNVNSKRWKGRLWIEIHLGGLKSNNKI